MYIPFPQRLIVVRYYGLLVCLPMYPLIIANPSNPLIIFFDHAYSIHCKNTLLESIRKVFTSPIYFEVLSPKLWCLSWVLSFLYHRLGCVGKPGLQGLAYSSLRRLCTGWRSHNPQTDLNSSRKALDPESTHFLQTTWPKREGIFGHGWNPWLKSATSGHRHTCASIHTRARTHTNKRHTHANACTHISPADACCRREPGPACWEGLSELLLKGKLL